MLSATVAVLACLCLARSSPPEPRALRAFTQNSYNNKDLSSVLITIEERLRVLDTISAVQVKQARRIEVIQDKLDRVETTLSLRLERAQLAAERLEHRLHMLQTSVQSSIKESSNNLERSQVKLTDIAVNLTHDIEGHRHLLEKVNGAYSETWRRGLVLENMMREGLSLVNVTRRELADGLRALARRQRDARHNSADLEAAFTRRINDNAYRIDLKMQELIDKQKQFVDSCQRVQLDDPTQVADVLDKLIDSLINKTAATFHELQNIQSTIRTHDNKVTKLLSTARPTQNDATCRRLEGAFKNISHTTLRETELQQLTEKFVALTDRADAALQRLEARMADDADNAVAEGEVTADADRLLLKLKGIREESDEGLEWEDETVSGYFDDDGGGDMMEEDKQILTGVRRGRHVGSLGPSHPTASVRTPHRRHLHKHPYDRGPKNQPSKS